MGFFITMFLCNMIIPLTMIIAGYLMYRRPPKEINGWIGYRTPRSKKSPETWAFAHERCGRLWLKAGRILIVPTIAIQLPFAGAGEEAIGAVTMLLNAVQIAAMLGSVIAVEIALKRNFDENGNRRQGKP